MAENSFNRALREVVSGEFSNIPLRDEEILHTFSNVFLRKMDKLTKAEKRRFWRMTSTVPKRIAVIMASLPQRSKVAVPPPLVPLPTTI